MWILEEEELLRLLNAPKGSDEVVLRDRAILELLFSTGLRVSEAAKLEIEQINLKRDEFSVTGKRIKAADCVFERSCACGACGVHQET